MRSGMMLNFIAFICDPFFISFTNSGCTWEWRTWHNKRVEKRRAHADGKAWAREGCTTAHFVSLV